MAKRLTTLGLFCALSLIMFMVESLMPPIIIPGAKLGLGNIFVMLALIYLSLPEALLMVLAKAVLAGIFGGNMFSLLFSLSAGVFSLLTTYLLLKLCGKKLSVLSISATSSNVHILTQLGVFAVINQSKSVLIYAPYLALIGTITGLLTGFLVLLILKRDFKVLNFK